jgi:hypothetical protein
LNVALEKQISFTKHGNSAGTKACMRDQQEVQSKNLRTSDGIICVEKRKRENLATYKKKKLRPRPHKTRRNPLVKVQPEDELHKCAYALKRVVCVLVSVRVPHLPIPAQEYRSISCIVAVNKKL